MADGDGLDRKIGKYAEYFSVMGAAWPKVPRDLGRVPCNQLSIWSRSPCLEEVRAGDRRLQLKSWSRRRIACKDEWSAAH